MGRRSLKIWMKRKEHDQFHVMKLRQPFMDKAEEAGEIWNLKKLGWLDKPMAVRISYHRSWHEMSEEQLKTSNSKDWIIGEVEFQYNGKERDFMLKDKVEELLKQCLKGDDK